MTHSTAKNTPNSPKNSSIQDRPTTFRHRSFRFLAVLLSHLYLKLKNSPDFHQPKRLKSAETSRLAHCGSKKQGSGVRQVVSGGVGQATAGHWTLDLQKMVHQQQFPPPSWNTLSKSIRSRSSARNIRPPMSN